MTHVRPLARALPNGRHAIISLLFALASCGDPSAPVSTPDLTALAGKGGPPADYPVTTTISNADATGLLLTRSDNASGSSAQYGNDGHIVADGSAWQLYLGNQSVRKVWLTLAGQGIAGIPDGYYYTNVELYSRCFTDATGTTYANLLTMTNGTSNPNCTFGVDFAYGGTKYKLAMGPNIAGTSHATATCTAPATGACTTWTVASNPANNVARLYKFGKQGSLIAMGDYHNTYAVTLSR